MKKLTATITIAVLAAGLLAARAVAQETSAPSASTTASSDAPRPRMKIPEPANPKLPSLFLAGDSTVRNGADDGQGKGAEGQWGWGHTIADLFDPAKINVVNRAVGGLSSRTYLTGGHWERLMAMLKPGDFVIIQLGTNDDGALNDEPPGPLRARGTIHGVGDETKEIDNVMTKKHEVVHTYGWYLRKFIDDTKSKNATPILCSIVPRKSWDDSGRARRNTNYEGWAAEVAAQEKIGFIDLNEMIARRYDELGRAAVTKLYPQVTPDEHTHTNLAGAVLNAQCVVAGLKALKGDPLAPFLSAAAKDIAPADLGKPAPAPMAVK
jgi:lysophospholipase L1-like esterase